MTINTIRAILSHPSLHWMVTLEQYLLNRQNYINNTSIKKTLFSVIFVCLSILTIHLGIICCHANDSTQCPQYKNPTGVEFPIMAWTTYKTEKDIIPENFSTLYDGGFNLSVTTLPDISLTTLTLKAASGSGVKILIDCPQIKDLKTIPKTISLFRNNPNLMGYYITDEPQASSFPKWKEYRDLIYQHDTIHLPFINLLPIVETERLQASDYETYIRKFINIVNLPFFSFDNYPIIEKNNKITIRETFYENLEIASRVSICTSRPFWAFCLSAAHYNYPTPTKSHLLFEAFSALAYGAQGLSYYTYATRTDGTIKYHDAPLDSLGNKTKTWYIVQEVNQQIHNLTSVFLGSKLLGAWHTGDNIPRGTSRLHKLPSPFKKLISGNKGVLITHLTNNGKNYLIIVNHDVVNSQKISLTKDKSVKRIYPDGKTKSFASSKLTLDAGGYAIFVWQ